MPKGGSTAETPPGTAAPEQWQPYKVWIGDEWICRGCGHLIITGVANQPVSEHYQDGFAAALERAGYLTVNDC
jgi:hypothetical protein